MSLVGILGATWWVATPTMIPITLIVGLLIVQKIRRFAMVLLFWIIAICSISLNNRVFIDSWISFAQELLVSWPLIFFATVMLTEPFTMPSRKNINLCLELLLEY